MNIEEAIEILKQEPDFSLNYYNRENAIDVLLTAYEKQSKEIEELKEDRDKFKKALGKRITYCNELEKDLFENCTNYVVSKDKIKAKIQECREILYSFEKELELKANKDKFIHKESMNCLLGQISILQSLLEKE